MNNLVATVAEIKKVYLNVAADLEKLSTKLEQELVLLENTSGENHQRELFFLCNLAKEDASKNSIRCVDFARLHNKINPPLHIQTKRKKVPYLRLVK